MVHTVTDNCRSAQNHVLVLNVFELFAVRACFNADTFCLGITLVMTSGVPGGGLEGSTPPPEIPKF